MCLACLKRQGRRKADAVRATGHRAGLERGQRRTSFTCVVNSAQCASSLRSTTVSIDRPSKYQQDIFEWVRSGSGNLLVEAVAGSGKSTTLVECWTQIRSRTPHARGLFLAFNTEIANELKPRVPGAVAKTLHAYGYAAIRRSIGDRLQNVDEKKALRLARSIDFGELLKPVLGPLFLRRFVALWNSVRLHLLDTSDIETVVAFALSEDVFGPALRFTGTRLISEEIVKARYRAVASVLAEMERLSTEAVDRSGCIDFPDMLWFPVVRNLIRPSHRWIFVDEAQDLNPVQLALIAKLQQRETRMMFVGDSNQSINGWAGADSDALIKIAERFSPTVLPLSVTYRCPSLHVQIAQILVPRIEARNNAPAGDFLQQPLSAALQGLPAHALILCRQRQPLVEVCMRLRKAGKNATVKDDALRGELTDLLTDQRDRLSNFQHSCDQFRSSIRRLRDNRKERETQPEWFALLSAYIALVDSSDATSFSALQREIAELFAERKDGIRCLTAHKSKGLSAEHVLIIYPELFDTTERECTEEECRQERNLFYVAITRSKQTLIIARRSLETLDAMEGRDHDQRLAFDFLGTALGLRPPADTSHPAHLEFSLATLRAQRDAAKAARAASGQRAVATFGPERFTPTILTDGVLSLRQMQRDTWELMSGHRAIPGSYPTRPRGSFQEIGELLNGLVSCCDWLSRAESRSIAEHRGSRIEAWGRREYVSGRMWVTLGGLARAKSTSFQAGAFSFEQSQLPDVVRSLVALGACLA